MKRIYTSNYARNGQHPLAVSISVFAPKWFRGKMLPVLAPTWDLVSRYKAGTTDQRQYTVEYLRLLYDRIDDPQKLIETIPNNAILLCYESPNDFCHRHIARNWLQSQCENVIIEEQLKSYKGNTNET